MTILREKAVRGATKGRMPMVYGIEPSASNERCPPCEQTETTRRKRTRIGSVRKGKLRA